MKNLGRVSLRISRRSQVHGVTFSEDGAVSARRARVQDAAMIQTGLVDISYAISMHSSWWMKKRKMVRVR